MESHSLVIDITSEKLSGDCIVSLSLDGQYLRTVKVKYCRQGRLTFDWTEGEHDDILLNPKEIN